jgi:hypothetical protein
MQCRPLSIIYPNSPSLIRSDHKPLGDSGVKSPKIDSTAPHTDAYKSAGRQRGTARVRRRSERTAVTYAEGSANTRSPTRCIPRAQGEEQMMQSVLVGLSVLALAACTPQPSPQMGAGTQPVIPAAYAAGSPSNTTSAFDGTYTHGTVRNISKGKEPDVAGGKSPIYCPNYGSVPPVTIHNGLAQFQPLNLYTFQGYVTPQGHLKMDSGKGQIIEGQIDDQGVLRGHGPGACAYDATWLRSV